MDSAQKRKRGKIKYKYARNKFGELIFVNELENIPEVRKSEFTCLSCGNLLIPRLGKIKQKHFAHKQVCDCSLETYLHQLAKELFLREYKNCLDNNIPFYLEIPIETYCEQHKEEFGKTCNLGRENRRYDLTIRYRRIQLEAEVEGFIPDIYLSNHDETKKLFVEIFVTHKSSEKKIDSGFNIIEIKIESEEDIEVFQNKILSDQENVQFYGFDIKPVKVDCPGEKLCPNQKKIFKVFNNGKSICTNHGLPGVSAFIKTPKKSIRYYEIIDFDYYWSGEDYISKVIEVYGKAIPIKNCYLCRHYDDNLKWDNEGKPIFCRFLRIRCNSNQAAECQHFKI